ncbi:MAG: diguanylate cyclase [Campylobacterales bacterium]|nr:diguanylate cyclase [Campylobacterales bacterium]
MKLSIRQIFFNLKVALIVLVIVISALSMQLFTISQYSDHLTSLKNQHALIQKIMTTNLDDFDMATIKVHGEISELSLYTQLSTKEVLIDFISVPKAEQKGLTQTLTSASSSFQEAALFWIESMPVSRHAMYQRMIFARTPYLIEIDKMFDYKVQRIDDSIKRAQITSIALLVLIIIIFLLYRFRLNQIYRDIHSACYLDTDATKAVAITDEINYLMKRLSRRSSTTNTNPTLLHSLSGINTEKGMQSAHATKRSPQKMNSLFLVVFEIDQYAHLNDTLSKEDMGGLFKKLANVITLYEQPMDIVAHLNDDRFSFLLSRKDKKNALAEIEKIVSTVADSIFTTSKGALKITLSAGFILKVPAKSLEDSLIDAKKIVEKAKELGGNCIAQLH